VTRPYPYEPQDPFGDAELDGLAMLALEQRVAQLLDELRVEGSIRREMLDEPRAAYAILVYVQDLPVKNPATQAIRFWAQRRRPQPPLEGGPPTLSALEFAWSRDTLPDGEPNPAVSALLKLMAAAITRHGGFAQLQASFHERQWFDPSTGELLMTFRDP